MQRVKARTRMRCGVVLSALLEHEARAQMRAWRSLQGAGPPIGHAHSYHCWTARAALVRSFTVGYGCIFRTGNIGIAKILKLGVFHY